MIGLKSHMTQLMRAPQAIFTRPRPVRRTSFYYTRFIRGPSERANLSRVEVYIRHDGKPSLSVEFTALTETMARYWSIVYHTCAVQDGEEVATPTSDDEQPKAKPKVWYQY